MSQTFCNSGESLLNTGEPAIAMKRLAKFIDEVTKGRRTVMVEEERVERSRWIANS